jgi:predicted small metal-binding protein
MYTQTCPRCGREFAGDERDSVADDVVEHAHVEHRHELDREIVLAHLEGVHPYEREE